MPLLKLFEIIENLLEISDNEKNYSHSSIRSKRRLSQTRRSCSNSLGRKVTYSSLPILDISIVSLSLINLYFNDFRFFCL